MENTTINTMTIALSVDSLLQMVYAESAWRFATKHAEQKDSPLLSEDRRAVLMPMLAEALGQLNATLSAYVVSNNADVFQDESMLKMELRHRRPLTDAGHKNYSMLVSQTLVAQMLAMCYPCDEQYAERYRLHRNALLTTLALDEQNWV